MATIPWYDVHCVDCEHKYILSLEEGSYWNDDWDAEKPICPKCGSVNLEAKKTWY
jgi:Zn finger protein HypA/HybF involved in hydrogenase expression